MSNEINRIGINTGSVNSYAHQPKDTGKSGKKETETQQANAPAKPQVNPDDVLSYMAQNAAVINPQVAAVRTYDVSKYVTPEQAARIAGFIASFDEQVAKGLIAIDEEFGENNVLSEPAKYEIAAAMVK